MPWRRPHWIPMSSRTTLSQKNNTDVSHYNYNAHQLILVIFGRDTAEWVCCQMVICCPTSPSLYLCTTWGNIPQKLGLFGHVVYCLENDSALACYIFNIHQPILIIFVDNKSILLGTVCKYYFSFSHFCVLPIRKQDQYYQLWGCCVVCHCRDDGQLTQQTAAFVDNL